jgi:hypothetical protein
MTGFRNLQKRLTSRPGTEGRDLEARIFVARGPGTRRTLQVIELDSTPARVLGYRVSSTGAGLKREHPWLGCYIRIRLTESGSVSVPVARPLADHQV